MRFEFDPRKSASNKAKHGIDFVEAQRLWDDDFLLEAPAKSDDEPRFMAIGMIDGRRWAAICVGRGEAVRIISVRRARKEEVEHYESL
jgi:uncharacterized DUF497 family protein